VPPSKSRPWRALAALGLIIVVLYVVMFATSTLTPRLGLDLRGGTSITLTASPTAGQGGVTKDKLDQATQIISSRVSGSGVTEPEITTQGSDNIVIAVPGVNADQIVKLVGQTAELRFRQVLAITAVTAPIPVPTPTPTASPSATPKATAKATPNATAKATAKGSNDRYPQYAAPSTSATPTPTVAATAAASPSASTPATSADTDTAAVIARLIKQTAPTAAETATLDAFTCDKYDPGKDDPNANLLACDRDGTAKYLLGPAIVLGTDVNGASAGIPQNQATWAVQLDLRGDGVGRFSEATNILSTLQGTPPLSQFAIVLDGRVISDPTVNEPIPGGQASITGNFTQESALELANVLKYGALPLRFEVSSVDSVSPLLGADQLRGSLLAGAIGLLLVIVYCFFYYRGLGIVVVASLGVAAAITYAMVCLLGKAQGLTLTLAGIAGLIVSIGITADSFIVYFERLRDEVRDGRSLRTSVESGWLRARRTILASDSISLLAAVVLYVLSIGSVRGFAYTLGLTTIVDLAVVMLFTKPMVTLLARTEFFGNGHRFSGLDPERLGTTRAPIRGGRGRARKAAVGTGTGVAGSKPDASDSAIVEG
jgi:preprotein translocase subunit SecD